jgi:hypothetical protein
MRRRIVQRFGVGTLGLYLTLAASGACLAQECVGDCNGDGVVAINELITAVNVGLGTDPADACPALNCNTLSLPSVICIIQAVNNALNGCRPAGTVRPTATPTWTTIPTPTIAVITYRLTGGSTILSSPAPADVGGPTLKERLTGTFIAVSLPPWLAPNVHFTLAVSGVEFRSPHFIVRGAPVPDGACTRGDMAAGCIEAPLYPLPTTHVAYGGINAVINGQPVRLVGSGYEDTITPITPTFQPLELCGPQQGEAGTCADIRAGAAGYSLTIFAEPAS